MGDYFIDSFQALYDRLIAEGYDLSNDEVYGNYRSASFKDGEFRLCFTDDYGEHVYPVLANKIACDPCFDKWKTYKIPFYVELPITQAELDWVISQINYWYNKEDAYEISKNYKQKFWVNDYPEEIKFNPL